MYIQIFLHLIVSLQHNAHNDTFNGMHVTALQVFHNVQKYFPTEMPNNPSLSPWHMAKSNWTETSYYVLKLYS